jgi:hypothetical protein
MTTYGLKIAIDTLQRLQRRRPGSEFDAEMTAINIDQVIAWIADERAGLHVPPEAPQCASEPSRGSST